MSGKIETSCFVITLPDEWEAKAFDPIAIQQKFFGSVLGRAVKCFAWLIWRSKPEYQKLLGKMGRYYEIRADGCQMIVGSEVGAGRLDDLAGFLESEGRTTAGVQVCWHAGLEGRTYVSHSPEWFHTDVWLVHGKAILQVSLSGEPRVFDQGIGRMKQMLDSVILAPDTV
jgi:hypothetical protein